MSHDNLLSFEFLSTLSRKLKKINRPHRANYKYILLVEGGYPNFIKYSKNCYLVKRVLIHRNNIFENILDIEHVNYYLKKIIGKS